MFILQLSGIQKFYLVLMHSFYNMSPYFWHTFIRSVIDKFPAFAFTFLILSHLEGDLYTNNRIRRLLITGFNYHLQT